MFVLFLEFLCDYLGDLRETHGVLFGDWLSKLACLSPADYADYADEYSKLYYFAEKDCLELVWFWGFVCDYQRDLREIYWGSLCNNLSSLM